VTGGTVAEVDDILGKHFMQIWKIPCAINKLHGGASEGKVNGGSSFPIFDFCKRFQNVFEIRGAPDASLNILPPVGTKIFVIARSEPDFTVGSTEFHSWMVEESLAPEIQKAPPVSLHLAKLLDDVRASIAVLKAEAMEAPKDSERYTRLHARISQRDRQLQDLVSTHAV
jgi:hypothetical protein